MKKRYSTKSVKAKSRRLQNFVAGMFLHIGHRQGLLHANDVTPRQMGGAGTDTVFSPKAQRLFPYAVECKQVEHLNVAGTFDEHAKKYALHPELPILVHSKNRSEILVTLTLRDFLCLVHGKHPTLLEGVSPGVIHEIFDKLEDLRDSWSSIEWALPQQEKSSLEDA